MSPAIFEVWGELESGIGHLITTPEGIRDMLRHGQIESGLSPLYCVRAESWADAMAYHHEHNGWEPYKPPF